MNAKENAPEKEPDHRRIARRKRAERWERAIQDSGHAYTPTEENTRRRNFEIIRDQQDNDRTEELRQEGGGDSIDATRR